jgi:DNA-binding MarR family transcriptional regulator
LTELTPKEQQVLVELRNLDHHPTVRSLADHMETRIHRSERWSDDEIRGQLERLVAKGYVAKYEDTENKAVRYQPTIKAAESDPPDESA